MSDRVLVLAHCKIVSKRKAVKTVLELQETCLRIRSIDSGLIVDDIVWEDVYGCHRMKSKDTNGIAAYFCIYMYKFFKTTERKASSMVFQIDDDVTDNRAENLKQNSEDVLRRNIEVANRCVAEILQRIATAKAPHHSAPVIDTSTGLTSRRLYILVNPYSGPGHALNIFQDEVMPVLAQAGIVCKLVITERANHARDLIRELDLTQWDGLVIVSGDGLVFEVLNGLAERSDRDYALTVPLAIIPGGSGNALISSVLYACREPFNKNYIVLPASLFAAKPGYIPVKLVRVETPQQSVLTFMAFGWGIIADIDIESERFRRTLGSARFFAGTLLRIANLRKYRGRVSYLPALDVPFTPRNNNSQYNKSVVPAAVTRSQSDGMHLTDRREMNQTLSKKFSVMVSTRKTSGINGEPSAVESAYQARMVQQVPFDTSTEDLRRLVSNDYVSIPRSAQAQFPTTTTTHGHVDNSDISLSTVDELRARDVVTMPRLDEPVPPDWVVIEDEFVSAYACYLSHISADLFYLPPARLDDGIMYLTLIRGSVTRPQLARLFLAIEKGEHLGLSCIETIPVRAVRIEPGENCGGFVTADGEVMPECGPIQGVVSSYTATVMCKHDYAPVVEKM